MTRPLSLDDDDPRLFKKLQPLPVPPRTVPLWAPFATGAFGLIAGSLCMAAWAKTHPPEVVEVVREVPAKVEKKAEPAARPAPPTPPVVPKSKVESPPAPPPWVPGPGEVCTAEVPAGMALKIDETRYYPLPRDVFALERLVKYVNARDSDGVMELMEQSRVLWFTRPTVTVKVIAVNQRTGVVEVRVTDGWVPAKDWSGRPVRGMLNQEAVVFMAQLSEVKK